MKKSIPFFTLLAFILSACSTHTQTSSGRAYLDQYGPYYQNGGFENGNTGVGMDDLVREVASVEPILKFPAKIGIARIEYGKLTNIPEEEIEAWLIARDNIGSDIGEFIPLNTMIADMVSGNVQMKTKARLDVISKIRLGAARQHLDAVLIYEVYSKAEAKSNILSVANITLIGGYLLPSKGIEAEGFSNALLIDVVQGYPYGTAEVILDKEEAFSTSNNSRQNKDKLSNEVKTKAAIKLTKEVETLFAQLKQELGKKQGN